MPHGCKQHDRCDISAPPMPPSMIDSVQVDQAAYSSSEDILSLTISWMSPMYPNGVLKHYQLHIGTVPILPQADKQESETTILSRTEIRVSEMADEL